MSNQDPNQFRDDDQERNPGESEESESITLTRCGRLGGIVMSKIADNDIRVEADHR
jgi:hypothetical protein